jgi:hypothetical protein
VTRPRWIDADAVADWVYNDRRAELLREQGLGERETPSFWTLGGEPIFDGDTEIYLLDEPSEEEAMRDEEARAVEAAMRGDPSELARLIEIWSGHNAADRAEPNPIAISAATWKLVVEFLRGQRSLTTGRHRDDEQRGRRRMSDEERTRRTPIHEAATEVSAVARVLEAEYRDQVQSETDIRDRARYVVARRLAMAEARARGDAIDQNDEAFQRRTEALEQTLYNYHYRGPGDRRRLR